MPRVTGNTLIQTDRICDYIPLASTITNLVDLFEKCAFRGCCNSKSITENRYFSHINDKKILRCIILLVPILGNIIIAIYDLIQHYKAKRAQSSEKEVPQESTLKSQRLIDAHMHKVCNIMRKGNLEEFKKLLDEEALAPNTVIYANENQTLLHRAVIYEQYEIIEELLKRLTPEQINAKDREGNTAIGLLTCRKTFNAHEHGGINILNEYYFSDENLVKIGKLLIDHHADITIPNNNANNYLPLPNAVIKYSHDNSLAFIELLIKHTKEMNTDYSKLTLAYSLALAVLYSRLKIINMLLDNGANETILIEENNLLHLAIVNDTGGRTWKEIMQVLLQRSPTLRKFINECNSKGHTPLHLAARSAHLDLVKLLVCYEADPKILTNDNKNAKQLAQGFIDEVTKKVSNQENIRAAMGYMWKWGLIPDAENIITFLEHYESTGPQLSLLCKIKARGNPQTEETGFGLLPPDIQKIILYLIDSLGKHESETKKLEPSLSQI